MTTFSATSIASGGSTSPTGSLPGEPPPAAGLDRGRGRVPPHGGRVNRRAGKLLRLALDSERRLRDRLEARKDAGERVWTAEEVARAMRAEEGEGRGRSLAS